MSDKQANDVRDSRGNKQDASESPGARGPMVICPKCQAQNPADRVTCSQCRAKLLPGRSILERIGYLIGGVVLAAVFVGLAWFFTQMEMAEALPPCCAPPLTVGLLALSCLVGGLRMAFSRTPEYEKYVNRAQRHVEAAPEQALADFTKALELAPEKEQAGILKQRGELYKKLERKEEAVADLSEYVASPYAHRGAKLVSKIVGVDMEESASALTDQPVVEGLRRELVQEGALKAVGYCRRCKDAVELDKDRRCSRCGGQVKEPRFVKPEASDAELAKLRKEAAARRTRRLIWLTIGGVALLVCALCVGMGVWSSRMREGQEEATATVAVAITAAPTTFAEGIFSFEYPSNWDRITEEEIDALLESSLKGLRPGGYDYIGGVYTGGVSDCRGCAQIVIVVTKDPSLTGSLTDEQYEQVKEAAEQQMGSRLISHRKTEISAMPAAEYIHVGASRLTKLWELIIVPPEPGVAYLFSCSSHKDSYADFEEIFERAIESLRIEKPTPETTSTPEPTVGPTVGISDCTLGAVFQADVTVPDNTRVEIGQPFTKTWRIRNTGTCKWRAGYRLTFIDGDQMGGPDSVDVPETVAGESAEISVELVAPMEAGQHRGNWQMCVNQSECFGEKIYVQIVSFD
jgi:tetratricopeptide (TPR) repeat protein